MVDGRRAVRRWFLRGMSWLLPGLTAAIVVFVRLGTESSVDLWLRLPALAIAGGVMLLFMALAIVPVLVLSSWNRGNRRHAQSLRREFQSYPTVALLSLSLALLQLMIPLLLAPGPQAPASPARTLAGPRRHRVSAPESAAAESAHETSAFAPVSIETLKPEPLPARASDEKPLPVEPHRPRLP